MAKKPKTYTFDAVIEESRGGASVIVPFDVEKEFGKKRIKIKATFDGVPYQGSLGRYGSKDFMLIILKEIREKIGKGDGDIVKVTFHEDLEPRAVKVPIDFQKLMNQEPIALDFYKKLAYTYQKEYIRWIEGAKRQETRERRMKKAVEMLKLGKKGI